MARVYMPFEGFTLFGIYSGEFNVYRTLNGSRFNSVLSPDFENITESVAGMKGEYDFGVNIKSRRITLNCYCCGITESQFRQLQRWLSPTQKGQLILDEAPYKAYTVRLTQPVEFTFVTNKDIFGNIYYNGTFTLELIATDPYAYSVFNSLDGIQYDNNIFYNSGILYSEYLPPVVFTNITSSQNIVLYNGGTERSNVNVKINGTWQSLTITNLTTNQSFTLSAKTITGLFEVDANYGQCRLNSLLANEYHLGTYIQLEGTDRVQHYSNVQFVNGSKVVTFPSDVILDDNVVGKYIFLSGSRYKISKRLTNNQIELTSSFTGSTAFYNIVIVTANEISLTGTSLNISSLEFEYKYTYI